MRVIIAGGGIGGLSLALSLHQAGIDTILCEAVRVPEPLGVGIILRSAAMLEFESLGLADDLSRLSADLREARYYSDTGRELHRRPTGLGSGYRWPAIGVHRGRLQMLLLEQTRLRIGPENLRTGMRLLGWRMNAGRIDQLEYNYVTTILEVPHAWAFIPILASLALLAVAAAVTLTEALRAVNRG